MQFCQECGAKNKDLAKFCCACGSALSAEDAPAAAGSLELPAAMLSKDVEQGYRAAFHIPQTETIITSIGNGYIQNLLMEGRVNKTIAVATNRRFYYQGRALKGDAGGRVRFSREIESGSIQVRDITYTGMKSRDCLWMKVVAIVLTVLVAWNTVIALPDVLSDPALLPVLLVLACIQALFPAFFWYRYYQNKTGTFVVRFAGGGLGVTVKYYSAEEIKEFQEKMARLVDAAKG